MVTTSSNLVVGNATIGRRGGNGKGRLAALIATATLGCSLLVGGAIGLGRQAAAPATSPVPTNPYWAYAEDVAIDGDPRAAAMALVRVNPYWTYEEDVVLNGNPAAVPYPSVPDQFTYREDGRVGTSDGR